MSGLLVCHAGVLASNAAVTGQTTVARTRSAGVRRCAKRWFWDGGVSVGGSRRRSPCCRGGSARCAGRGRRHSTVVRRSVLRKGHVIQAGRDKRIRVSSGMTRIAATATRCQPGWAIARCLPGPVVPGPPLFDGSLQLAECLAEAGAVPVAEVRVPGNLRGRGGEVPDRCRRHPPLVGRRPASSAVSRAATAPAHPAARRITDQPRHECCPQRSITEASCEESTG